MPISLQELQRLRNVVDRSSYIRMAIQLGRDSANPYTPYQIYPDSLTANFGITREELHTELSTLTRGKQIQGTLPSFTATWADPNILTSYNPEQVIQLRGSGMFRQKGYLFFCLGAENPNKVKIQLINPNRLIEFYGMTIADFFGELGRMVGEKTLSTDIDRITVQWLAYSSSDLQTTASETIAAALEDMRRRIAELSAPVPTTANVTTNMLQLAIADLRAEIAQAQAQNTSADTNSIQEAITNLQQGIDSRNYVVAQALNSAIASLQTQMSSADSAQADVLSSAVERLQAELNTKQVAGDYVPTSALRSAIASLQTTIDSKQLAGDYASTQTVMAAIGDLQKAIDSKNYVMSESFNSAIASLQTAISGKQAAGDYASSQNLASAVSSLQSAIAAKQSTFIINAADYGARGDLVYRETSYNTVTIVSGTDTTDKIQAALNVAGAMVPSDINLPYEGSIRVVVPGGKYILSETLIVPPNVVLDCKDAVFFNFLSNDWAPAIWGKRHSHATRIKLHANKKSGIWWGDPNAGGVRCDSYIDEIWVEHGGVEFESTLLPMQQKCGLRLFGLWYRINRIEIKEANLGLDIKASDVLCPAVFLMGCATALRLESAEQITLPSVQLDTNINTGIQIDNSGNVFICATAFTNSDGYGTGLYKLIDVGTWSGVTCKDIYIWAAAVSTGGQMLSVSNCMDSSFTLFASNARLFSQTSEQGQATSHWKPTATGGLLAHNIGTNYQPYGNEGTPTGLVKYGKNLSGYLKVDLSCDPAIARTEGAVYGNLLINGVKAGTPVPKSVLRMNCGGAACTEYNKTWAAEQYVVGGGGTATPTSLDAESDLIKTIRWGLTGYDIPLAPGVYTLQMWFIEPENSFRKFDISLQGQIWQSGFSIYDEAGGFGRVVIKNFSNVVVNNMLSIRFNSLIADAIITALEIIQ